MQNKWLIWLSSEGAICGGPYNHSTICSALDSMGLPDTITHLLYQHRKIENHRVVSTKVWIFLNKRDTSKSLRLDFDFKIGKPSNMDCRIIEFITLLFGTEGL